MARSIDCFQSIISDWDDYQLWDHFEAIVNYCSPRRHLAINRYQNFDEFKYFRRPVSFRDEHAKCVKYPEKAPAKYWQTPNHNCTIVTLGIGRDVVAERQLKSDHPQCRFVGADPVQFINEVLYREVGEYHQIAVGTRNESIETLVYRGENYTKETVESVDLPYFLKDTVGSTVIDLLLIDVEYVEYDLFAYFLDSNSSLDRKGINVCQVNMEVHIPKEEENHKLRFASFIRRLLADRRFHLIEASDFHNNKRLYFARVDHPQCL